ncbi:hypothetical protein UAY_00976 [Enterococcus moraviensis ATCC BAA-383]|uniref:LXG domain-containing protein n=1 Tax=Enterococcus moraviensis ATCC BAA-383 TaxID=1158609 RepID=R2TCE8_9ENTE|nr:hypothetical protein [Enterococcus moraviensis]EOI02729.1 hypothetical protein UAY_00976 [Enterococcus moraviensis ATCC BAA-383]EOT73894.1 hypothetical protein I586_00890 [Enterococcus moraviensis ATCC BAA-383]
MSIDMYLGQARSQASSVKSACSQLAQGYTSLMQSNQQFMSAGELSSKGYDSAKEFFAAVIQPLVQGAEVGADMTAEACQKFVDQYTTEVDSIDLKSDDLERRIRQINTSILNMESINRGLPKLPTGTNPLEQANRRIIESLETTKRDLEKKLEKLMTFNGTSPAIFDGVNSFYSTLSQGLQQANSGFNPATGTFSVPKGKALDWTKKVSSTYDKREVDRIAKLFPEKVTSKDLLILADIQKRDKDITFPKKVLESLKKTFGKYADDLSGIELDALLESAGEYLNFDALGRMLTNGSSSFTAFGLANINSASMNASLNGASSYAVGQIAKNVGIPAIGFTVGMLTDASRGNTLGQSIAHNTAVAGTATWLTAGGMILLGTNPAGWAIVSVAVLSSFAASGMYDANVFGLKDMSNDWAENFDSGLNKLSAKMNDIGQTVSGKFDKLVSSFGW